MATFKCLVSGNTVTFDGAYDIKQMRDQILDYVEVIDEDAPPEFDDPSVKVHGNKAKQRPYKGHKDNAASL